MKKLVSILIALTLLTCTFATAFACEEYGYYGNYGYYSQYARASTKLSLRSGPTTHSEGLGTYKMADEYVEVSARHWDDTNTIWWLEVSFYYKGHYITGWTGEQRFDPWTYDLYCLPEF